MSGAAREANALTTERGGRRRHTWPRRIVAALMGVAFAAWIASVAAVLVFASHEGAQTADAIVVLGAAQYAGRPSPVLRARIDHALLLWRGRTAPIIVFTGGVGVGDTTSEAAVSATYARKRGVPEDAILLESEGRTTSESIRSVAATLSARHATSVVLVSDPFHMFRLWILARCHGLHAVTSPTRSSPIWASVPASAGYILSESLKAPVAFLIEGLFDNP